MPAGLHECEQLACDVLTGLIVQRVASIKLRIAPFVLQIQGLRDRLDAEILNMEGFDSLLRYLRRFRATNTQ